MRACVQRVREASVTIEGEVTGRIGPGIVVLLGVAQDDTVEDAQQMADKLVDLRIFEDEQGKMNQSLADVNGEMLIVSQFTLLGDCRKGRRPSFIAAAEPRVAQQLYESVVAAVGGRGINVATGQFRAQMDVALVNNGPVTILLDSKKLF